MTWTVAAVAVETGIAPQFLMEDGEMLRAMIAYMRWRSNQQQQAQSQGRRRRR
jgi:cytochrome c